MLVVDLPILKIIPIEGHRLKLQVSFLPGPTVPSLLRVSWGNLGDMVKLWGQFREKLWYTCMGTHYPQGSSPSPEPVVETQGK